MRCTVTIKDTHIPLCLLYLRLSAITLNFVTFIFEIFDYFYFDILLFESLDPWQFIFVFHYVIFKILSFYHRTTLKSKIQRKCISRVWQLRIFKSRVRKSITESVKRRSRELGTENYKDNIWSSFLREHCTLNK